MAGIADVVIVDCEHPYQQVPPAAGHYLRTMLGRATTDLNAHYGRERVADVVRGALENLHGWRTDRANWVKHEPQQALAAVARPHGGA